jgi:hypothetical protein
LEALAQKLKDFVDFERKDNSRHKLIAHWNVTTILSSHRALGGFSVGQEVDFFNNLNDFIETMGRVFCLQDDWTILSNTRADEDILVKIIKTGSNSMKKK